MGRRLAAVLGFGGRGWGLFLPFGEVGTRQARTWLQGSKAAAPPRRHCFESPLVGRLGVGLAGPHSAVPTSERMNCCRLLLEQESVTRRNRVDLGTAARVVRGPLTTCTHQKRFRCVACGEAGSSGWGRVRDPHLLGSRAPVAACRRVPLDVQVTVGPTCSARFAIFPVYTPSAVSGRHTLLVARLQRLGRF